MLQNWKINASNIPAGFDEDMNLPLAFKDKTMNIKRELRAIAARHDVNYGRVVGRLKDVVWSNATNYVMARIDEHLSTKFVKTLTQPIEEKLSETIRDFFREHFFKTGPEEERIAEEEKKREKQQDQI